MAHKIKILADGSVDRYKALLVSNGFTQQEGVYFIGTFSRVAKFVCVKLILTLAAMKGWFLNH